MSINFVLLSVSTILTLFATYSTGASAAIRVLKAPREYNCALAKGAQAGAICTEASEIIVPPTGQGFPPVPGVTVLKISGWTIHASMGIATTQAVTQGLQIVFRSRVRGESFSEWTAASERFNTAGSLGDIRFGQYSAHAFVPANKDREYQFGMRYYKGELLDTASATYVVAPQAIID